MASMIKPTRKGAPASPRACVSIKWIASAEDRLSGVMTYLMNSKMYRWVIRR